MTSKFKTKLLCKSACISALMFMGAASANAQEAPAEGEDVNTDIIIVTGSRIARSDLSASVPISVVTQDSIQATGAANVQDVLADLPSVGSNISRTSSNFQNTGNGSATVNLRNLAEERTLVLVNGRRFVAGIPGTSIVDLNSIPTDLIKQVEVVTGGASAVYGSEAIAGVVNFIMDDKFEGLRTRAQTNVSTRGDEPRQLISITGGTSFADDRGHIVVNGQYDRDGGLRSRNRSWAAVDSPNRSSYAAQGLFSPTNTFSPGNAFTFDQNNVVKPYQGANIDGYNRQYDRYLAVPVQRWLGTAIGSFEFSPGAKFYAEATYARTKTNASLEPQAVDGSPSGTDLDLNGVPYEGIPIDNPFIPTAIRQAMIDAGVTTLPFRRRSNDIFDRSNNTKRETWRVVAGLKGELGTSLNLGYDVYYNHGETKDSTHAGTIFAPEYVNALDAVAGPNGPVCRINVDADPNNNDSACVPINIFGYNTVSPAAAAYITRNGTQYTYDAKVKQDVFSGAITGELGKLWGTSPISFAAGVEHRREKSSEDFDIDTNLGTTLGNNITDTFGKYNVTEGFLELVAPIIQERPFFHYFGIEGAARYADYSTVGGVWSWKLGAEWAPVPDIRFRGVYAEATRAPNISELFSANSETFPAVIDPCDQAAGEGDNAPIAIPANALPAACLAIPAIAAAAQNGGFTYSTAQIQTINGFLGGNRNLSEEKSQTITLGVVATPRFARNLSLTVDYYRIKVKNAVGIIGQQTSLDECYGDGGSGLDLFCDNITRTADGRVRRIDAINLNVGSYLVEGIDIGARYRAEFSESTSLDLTVNWTHLLKQQQTSFAGGPVQKERGQLDCYECGRLGTGFKDKANASLTLTYNNWSLNWRTNYLGPVVDTLGEDAIRVGSRFYHDAQLRIGIDKERKFTFYFGADNVFDKQPPLFGDTNVVTYPGTRTAAKTYDVFGRILYAGVDVRF